MIWLPRPQQPSFFSMTPCFSHIPIIFWFTVHPLYLILPILAATAQLQLQPRYNCYCTATATPILPIDKIFRKSAHSTAPLETRARYVHAEIDTSLITPKPNRLLFSFSELNLSYRIPTSEMTTLQAGKIKTISDARGCTSHALP